MTSHGQPGDGLGTCWEGEVDILGIAWVYLGDLLRTAWDGLGAVWGYLGNVLGTAWGQFKDILRKAWGSLGVSWGYAGDNLGTVWVLSLTQRSWIHGMLQRADKDKDNRMCFQEVQIMLRMANIHMDNAYAHQLFKVLSVT